MAFIGRLSLIVGGLAGLLGRAHNRTSLAAARWLTTVCLNCLDTACEDMHSLVNGWYTM